jgi:acetate kinase
MPGGSPRRVLTINTGSSSLKAVLYRTDGEVRREVGIEIERIGRPGGHARAARPDGQLLFERTQDFPDHDAALTAMLDWLRQSDLDQGIEAVGHRVVHGGPDYATPQVVSDALLAAVRRLVPFDPEHLPQALAAIDATSRAFPAVPQVACFDTAFHRGMPRVAQLFGLPADLADAGVIRYGFHGLSYESILGQLRELNENDASGRLVIAHLGNGASMVAVHNGCGVETTMGFTPTGGLVMGTRSGDLDPGVLLYLLRERGLNAAEIGDLVNRRAGLLGVSGISGDMRDLLARESDDPHAADAVALFCYHARKHLGSLVAVLGGLETLVFTGGIGEHAAPIRERICAGFEFLGIRLDPDSNSEHASVISRGDSRVTVRVMTTDEESVILCHTVRLLQGQG